MDTKSGYSVTKARRADMLKPLWGTIYRMSEERDDGSVIYARGNKIYLIKAIPGREVEVIAASGVVVIVPQTSDNIFDEYNQEFLLNSSSIEIDAETSGEYVYSIRLVCNNKGTWDVKHSVGDWTPSETILKYNVVERTIPRLVMGDNEFDIEVSVENNEFDEDLDDDDIILSGIMENFKVEGIVFAAKKLIITFKSLSYPIGIGEGVIVVSDESASFKIDKNAFVKTLSSHYQVDVPVEAVVGDELLELNSQTLSYEVEIYNNDFVDDIAENPSEYIKLTGELEAFEPITVVKYRSKITLTSATEVTLIGLAGSTIKFSANSFKYPLLNNAVRIIKDVVEPLEE